MVILDLPGGMRLMSAAALAMALLSSHVAARADDVQDATQFFRAGQHQQALALVNKAIQAKPSDPQARFLKGLILAESGSTREASDVFLNLTRDFPQLPEPYNNLAVIYAAQGQYDQARAALEQAMRTHPSYATAYENLGGVYAKLASRAYDKALQLDSAQSTARESLALVRELSGSVSANGMRPAAPGIAGAVSGPIRPPQTPPRPAAAAHAANTAAPVTPPADTPPPATKPAAQKPVAAVSIAPSGRQEVAALLQAWVQAWSRKDADTYLSFYAPDFVPPGGESRTQWAQARRARIAAPKSISVSIGAPKVVLAGDTQATATFRQSYQSDVFKGSSAKTLVLVKSDGRWLIRQERVGQ